MLVIIIEGIIVSSKGDLEKQIDGLPWWSSVKICWKTQGQGLIPGPRRSHGMELNAACTDTEFILYRACAWKQERPTQ